MQTSLVKFPLRFYGGTIDLIVQYQLCIKRSLAFFPQKRKTNKSTFLLRNNHLTDSTWPSSLHNIIFNSFLLVLVLWRLFQQSFLFLSYVVSARKNVFYFPFKAIDVFKLHKNFFEQLWHRKEKRKLQFNSLHTRGGKRQLKIILWRLLTEWIWLKHDNDEPYFLNLTEFGHIDSVKITSLVFDVFNRTRKKIEIEKCEIFQR